MQIDMHYFGTYCIARAAGFSLESARIVATSAQFVDDNAKQEDIELADGSSCKVEPTAHHIGDLNMNDADSQRLVWVPFHFLPGNVGSSFTERLICQKDSPIAQEMCAHYLSRTGDNCFLPLLGIMAHVYGDTFAHYGFSGVSSRLNRVEKFSFEFQDIDGEIKAYILGKRDSVWDKLNPLIRNIKSAVAEMGSNALGHAGVVTFPDRPFLKWRFDYVARGDSGWRNNVDTYMVFAEKFHAMVTQLANQHLEWADLSQQQSWQELAPKIRKILQVQAKKEERIKAWQEATSQGDLFIHPEIIPTYEDWNMAFDGLSSMSSDQAIKQPIYHFYQAASYHRWYVLRELLPKHKLMVI